MHPTDQWGIRQIIMLRKCDKIENWIEGVFSEPAYAIPVKRRQTLIEVRRREFAITDTEDKAIAPAAIIGDKRSPVIG